MKRRKIRYIGEHKDETILISNDGDVSFLAEGKFVLSGLMYCPRYSVEFNVSGQGTISLRGVCKKLFIKNITGDCLLDLSEVVCKEVYCNSAKGKSIIRIGSTKLISQANLEDEAILQYKGSKPSMNYILLGSNSSSLFTGCSGILMSTSLSQSNGLT